MNTRPELSPFSMPVDFPFLEETRDKVRAQIAHLFGLYARDRSHAEEIHDLIDFLSRLNQAIVAYKPPQP
jgi:hypothetical protein